MKPPPAPARPPAVHGPGAAARPPAGAPRRGPVREGLAQQLKAVRAQLRERRQAQTAAEAAAREAERQRLRQTQGFAQAVGPVQPLRVPPRHWAQPPAVAPVARQRQQDEQAVMQEALSDEFDVETLLHTDETLSFRRAGIGPDVVRKLRRGHWSLQGQIDLHGLRCDEARQALAAFIRHAQQAGWRCVRVIHGKGLGSPGKTPVLKAKTQRWLVQKAEVLAFVQARACDGGAGALLVLLAPAARD